MYLVIDKEDNVFYEALSLEEANINCPDGYRVCLEHERYYMVS